jgi:hypothetical protein
MAVPLMAMLLLWPILAGAARFLRRRQGKTPPSVRIPWSAAALLATGASFLFSWFLFGFTARSNRLLESGELLFGMPEALSRLLWIPYLHLALAGGLVLLLPLVWKRGWWDTPRRSLFTLVVGGLVLQAVFFVQWNYLPAAW